MKNLLILLYMTVLLSLVSCVKEAGTGTPADKGANPFQFTTSQTVQVTVQYNLPHNTYLEIYTENPVSVDEFKSYVKDETLRPVATGYTDAEGHFSLPVRLAAKDTHVYVYSPSVGAPVLLSGKVEGSQIVLTEANKTAPARKSSTRAIAETTTYWTKWTQRSFSFVQNPAWSWDAAGRPDYLDNESLHLDQATLNKIDAAIPKGKKLEMLTAQIEQIEISEDANVWLYFISNSSARRNALAYYTYTGEVPTASDLGKINSSLTILYPNLSSEALRSGDGVQLAYYDGTTWSETFPAGVKIGFALLVDAWDGKVATKTNAVYSTKAFNSYNIPSESTIMANRPHMAAFKADEHFILSFEDLPYNESPTSKYNGDFSDDVFVMVANPVTALPDVPSVDEETVPPYMTSVKDYGILAFEDNWPYKGDYDLNDVVVQYDSQLNISYDFDYTSLEDTYVFLNSGGKYTNAFGIEYGFPTSAINFDKSKIEASNGFEVPGFDRDAAKATLVLFRDAKDVPKGTIFKVRIVFNEPQSLMGFLLPPYNPFIAVDDQGGLRKEVHLVDHTPTVKADPMYFGYGHDLSGNGRYYVSDATYPFAIDMAKAESYRIPAEMHCISEFYSRFDAWATSDGKTDKDWYFE